jgi:hypothetical protein
LNGAWNRKLSRSFPIRSRRSSRGHRLRRAGASIIHTHAFEDGTHTFDWQVYARIIEGIRAQVEVPVYQSYPATPATGMSPASASPMSRRWPNAALLDFAVIDPGSCQLHHDHGNGQDQARLHLLNPEAPVRPTPSTSPARKGFHPRLRDL